MWLSQRSDRLKLPNWVPWTWVNPGQSLEPCPLPPIYQFWWLCDFILRCEYPCPKGYTFQVLKVIVYFITYLSQAFNFAKCARLICLNSGLITISKECEVGVDLKFWKWCLGNSQYVTRLPDNWITFCAYRIQLPLLNHLNETIKFIAVKIV